MTRPTGRFEQFVAGRLESIELSIDEILFEPPRQSTDRQGIETLARRISNSDSTTPISVYFRVGESTPYASDRFELKEALELANDRGWLLASKTIAVEARLDRELSQRLSAIANRLSSSETTQMMRADCIRELVDLNHPLKQIAKVLNVQQSYVNRLLALSFATTEIRTAIAQKELSTTTAMNVLAKYGSTKAEQLLLSAIEAAEQAGKKATGRFVDQYIQKRESGQRQADSGCVAKSWKDKLSDEAIRFFMQQSQRSDG